MIRLKNLIILSLVVLGIIFYIVTNLWNWSVKKSEAKKRYDKTFIMLQDKKTNLQSLNKKLVLAKEKFKKIEHLVINSKEVTDTFNSLKDIVDLSKYQFVDIELKSIKPDSKWINIANVTLDVRQRSMIPLTTSSNMLCSLLNSLYKVHKKECTLINNNFSFKLIKD